MANFTATQKREHAVLNKIQNELSFLSDRQTMAVSCPVNSTVPLAFHLDAFELIDGNIDFAPGSQQLSDGTDRTACMNSQAPAVDHDSVNAGPDSLEWFSRLIQNAAARAS